MKRLSELTLKGLVLIAFGLLAVTMVASSDVRAGVVEPEPEGVELGAICVQPFTSIVSAPVDITTTTCPSRQFPLLIPDDFPLTLTIDLWTSNLRYTPNAQPGPFTISLPDDGIVSLCVDPFTNRLRYPFAGSCPSNSLAVVLVGQTAPAAVDDGPYTTTVSTTLTVSAPGLLDNDELGIPAAEVTSISGGDLTGTTNVGVPTALAGGMLTVNADGSFTLVNPTISGDYSFDYTLTNVAGSDTATVMIQVQQAPDAVDDGPAGASQPGDLFHSAFETTLDSTVTAADDNLLSNDDLGVPEGDLASFGGGDLGGTVTTNTANSTVSPLPGGSGSLLVNADGSFSFTPPDGFTGLYRFDYRLTNVAGSDDATVTIAVGERPAATNDSYSPLVVGNVSIDTSTSSNFSVLANDSGDGLSFSTTSLTSVEGGDVELKTDGTFEYDPPPGYEGSDSFAYEIDNGFNDPQTGTVELTVAGMIWFIDQSASPGGDGRLSSPFDCLVGSGCFDAIAADEAGDNIYLASGAYTAGLTLLDNQFFIGAGASQSLSDITGFTPPADSPSLPATGGVPPTVTTSNAAGFSLGSSNTIRGLNIGNTGTGTGITGTNFGTLMVSEVQISGTGRAVNLETGVAAVTFVHLGSSGGVQGINLDGVSGSFTVTGATDIDTPTGDGIAINASPASFDFQGATTVDNAGVNGIVLTGGNGSITFSSIDLDTITSVGLSVQDNTNPVTINGGSIGASDDPGGNAVDISGGSANITMAASVTKTTPSEVVEVTGRGGGTVSFTNTVSCSSGCTGLNVSSNTSGTTSFSGAATVNTGVQTAVNLNTNGSHTVSFSGGLDIDTTSGVGFNATGGGTVEVLATGVTNTVDSTTGTAVTITSVTIGSQGVTFSSVSANGAPNGIVLDSTGTQGGFSVTGDGATTGSVLNRNASGGTITDTTGDSVVLTNIHNVTLRQMDIINGADQGIVSSGGSSHVFSAVRLEGQANEALDATNVGGTGNRIDNNSRIVQPPSAGGTAATDLLYSGGNSGAWTLDGGTYTTQGVTPNNGFTHTLIRTTGSGSVGTLIVQDTHDNCVFENIFGVAVLAGGGLIANDNSTINLTIQNCTFRNASTATGGGLNNVAFALSESTSGTANISNNLFDNVAMPLLSGGVITSQALGNSSMNVVINNNIIEDIGNLTGALGGHIGINVVTEGNSDNNKIQVTNNNIQRMGQREGILISMRDTSTNNDIRINNNTIGSSSERFHSGSVGNREAIELLVEDSSDARVELIGNTIFSDTTDESIDVDAENTATMNLHFTNNTVNASSGTAFDIETDNSGSTMCVDIDGNSTTGSQTVFDLDKSAGTTFSVEDLSDLNTDNPGVGSFNIIGGPLSSIPGDSDSACVQPSF